MGHLIYHRRWPHAIQTTEAWGSFDKLLQVSLSFFLYQNLLRSKSKRTPFLQRRKSRWDFGRTVEEIRSTEPGLILKLQRQRKREFTPPNHEV